MGTIANLLGFGQSAGPHYQLDYSTATGAGITTASQATLASTNGISNIIYASGDGATVMLRSDVDVDVIASNGYPRSEWRELATDGTTLRAFNPLTGDHTVEVLVLPTHLPPMKPSFVVCQLHDNAQDLIEVAVQPRSDFATTSKMELVCRINGTSSGIPKLVVDLGTAAQLGDKWLYCKIRVGAIAPGSAAGWDVSCNGTTVRSWDAGYPALSTSGANSYFKSGMYLQTKWTGSGTGGLETDRNEYGEAGWRVFKTYHNGESAPFTPTAGTQAFDTVSGVTWGTKASGHRTVSGNAITLTPGLPSGLADGDVMGCIVRASRAINSTTAPTAPGFQSQPSSPSIATGWTRAISTKSPTTETSSGAYAGGPQLAAHNVRWMLWVRKWASGDTAPQVDYPTGTTLTDTMTAQVFKCSGARWSDVLSELIDQAPAGLDLTSPNDNTNTITGITFAAATSTTVVGPTAALPANAQAGALAIACVYHETNATTGGVGVVTGGSDGLTWAEGGEGATNTTAGSGSNVSEDEPVFAHDWAIVPGSGSGQAIPAKQAAATISNDANKPNTGTAIAGKGWGLLFSIAPARQHGRRRAA